MRATEHETGGWNLFWRRKQNSEEVFVFDNTDRRTSFRVSPPLGEPIAIEFCGRSFLMKDIGAAGFSFGNDHLKAGDSQRVVFNLPGEDLTLSAITEIVEIDQRGVCHCRFIALSDDLAEVIDRYVLRVQKQELRGNNRSSALMPVGENGHAEG